MVDKYIKYRDYTPLIENFDIQYQNYSMKIETIQELIIKPKIIEKKIIQYFQAKITYLSILSIHNLFGTYLFVF